MLKVALTTKSWVFWLVLIVWLATAIPITLYSLFVFELPLWPSFSPQSTCEGTTLWAIFAVWYYITPFALVLVSRRQKPPLD